MSTIQETLLPAAMVPGLITIEDSKGRRQNVFPIDAVDLLRGGDYKLVENGAIEAARMAATPLRSGMASGIPSENIVAEVSGIEGRIVATATGEAAAKIIEESNAQADALPNDGSIPPVGASEMREARATGTAGTAGTSGTNGQTPDPDARPPADSKTAAKSTAKADDK